MRILALKVMMVAFQKQMTTHWSKVSKIVRELVGKKIGGTALYSFTEFVVDMNLPISLVILPILQSKVIFIVILFSVISVSLEIQLKFYFVLQLHL